jgi:hypothetical protein
MERLMRRIIPLQFACGERDIHHGGVLGDGKQFQSGIHRVAV